MLPECDVAVYDEDLYRNVQIIRSRIEYEPTFANWLIWRVVTGPISFVMERKMLQGIKRRAETNTSA